MKKKFSFRTTLFILLIIGFSFAGEIQTPSQYLGKKIGSDYTLAKWSEIVSYFQYLASESKRVNLSEMGKSTEGRPLILAVISEEETIASLELHKLNQKKLADPRLIKSDDEAQKLVKNSKVAVCIMCQQHSTEIGSSQMSMLLAHELATSDASEIQEILSGTILLLIPCANPDGHDKVVEYYQSTIGTPFEGGRLPYLYQKYAGHDINRDWFMLNLKETQVITRMLYSEWYPTIVWDVHQTGKYAYRLFVPPFYEPKNPNTHPLIDKMLYVVGGNMAVDLARAGKTGVIHSTSYDNYWAGGGRTTPHRHNILALLTEAASVNIASPVFIPLNQLHGERRGMPEYKMSVNFPDPWQGGWWRLNDIIDYELIAAKSLLKLAARYHDLHQGNYLRMGRDALEKGKNEPPFAYIIPPDQRDHRAAYELLSRLKLSGIEIHKAREKFKADGIIYPKGSFILYCSQPYRPHLIDMMARQFYPERSIYPGGPAERPYDIAGWTLPIQLGVNYVEAKNQFTCKAEKLTEVPVPRLQINGRTKGSVFILSPDDNDTYRLINRLYREKIPVSIFIGKEPVVIGGQRIKRGSIIVQMDEKRLRSIAGALGLRIIRAGKLPREITNSLIKLRQLKTAIFQPWTASMDEGWTRYVLDSYEFPYTVIHNADIRAGNLRERFDCIILPSVSEKAIIQGNPPGSTFDKYTGGIGNIGLLNLQRFVEKGGVLICLDRSCKIPLNYFHIPVKNALKDVKKGAFHCPGSLLRLNIDNSHPLGFGMDDHFSGFFVNSQVFEIDQSLITVRQNRESSVTTVELPENTHKISEIASYSNTVLLESGWIRGGEYIAGKPAIMEVNYGKGKVELIGIRVQHRAQTQATFKILFNAILFSPLED